MTGYQPSIESEPSDVQGAAEVICEKALLQTDTPMLNRLMEIMVMVIESRHPGVGREKRNVARRRQLHAQRKRDRKMPKPPRAIPTENNQPGECLCPRCRDRSDGFRWSPRERTWRCCVCRTPLRFENGTVQLNFDRSTANAEAGGWTIPDSTIETQRAIGLLGSLLLAGPRTTSEVRQEMSKEGFGRKLFNRAISVLRIRTMQLQRPGPLWCVLPEKSKPIVVESILQEFAAVLQILKREEATLEVAHGKESAEVVPKVSLTREAESPTY